MSLFLKHSKMLRLDLVLWVVEVLVLNVLMIRDVVVDIAISRLRNVLVRLRVSLFLSPAVHRL